MGTFTSGLDTLVNTLTGGTAAFESLNVFIDRYIDNAQSPEAAGTQFNSLWKNSKSNGANGATPGGAAALTRTTTGALRQADPSGGREKYLIGVSTTLMLSGTVTEALIVYDRLSVGANFTATANASAAVNTAALTRYNNTVISGTYPNAAGNQLWVENYTLSVGTPCTATFTYTNQDGTGSRVSKTVSIANRAGTMVGQLSVVPLQDGDSGVQSVQTVNISATLGTVGSYGVVIARPIAILTPGNNGVITYRDNLVTCPSLPRIQTGACIAFAYFGTPTAVATRHVMLNFAEA